MWNKGKVTVLASSNLNLKLLPAGLYKLAVLNP
jgi:hypothetical protein